MSLWFLRSNMAHSSIYNMYMSTAEETKTFLGLIHGKKMSKK